jgi:hypothetical protein
MPSFNEMLSDLPTHQNFYLRGVFNSLLPDFMNPLDREITEKNVSGEAVEFFRLAATTLRPDLQEGEVQQINAKEIAEFVGAEGNLGLTLGNFGLTKENGQYVLFDNYDFEQMGLADATKQILSGGGVVKTTAEYMGGLLMPENADGSSRDDALKVRIRIPNEPMLVDVDYDDDPPEGAEDMVLRGPMTNKRKNIFDLFISQAFALVADEASSVFPMQKPTLGERNNNYGNLRTNDAFEGKTGTSQSYDTYESPEMGLRALARVLDVYDRKHNIDTVDKLVNRYAPASDNTGGSHENYKKFLAERLDVGINEKIDVSAMREEIMDAIIRFENKNRSLASKSQIRAAIKLADKGKSPKKSMLAKRDAMQAGQDEAFSEFIA